MELQKYKVPCTLLSQLPPMVKFYVALVQYQNQEIRISGIFLLTRLQTLFGFHCFLNLRLCVFFVSLSHV